MLLTLIVAALLQASDPNGGSQCLSYFHGEQWNFVVSQEALDASPSWAADTHAPPLPPGSAVRAATQQLQQLAPARSRKAGAAVQPGFTEMT